MLAGRYTVNTWGIKMECLSVTDEGSGFFTPGKIYSTNKPSIVAPWAVMAYGDKGVGRYIHHGDQGEFREVV